MRGKVMRIGEKKKEATAQSVKQLCGRSSNQKKKSLNQLENDRKCAHKLS